MSTILHSPTPMRAENGPFPHLRLIATHKILEQ
jgi:hypothetical protein